MSAVKGFLNKAEIDLSSYNLLLYITELGSEDLNKTYLVASICVSLPQNPRKLRNEDLKPKPYARSSPYAPMLLSPET